MLNFLRFGEVECFLFFPKLSLVTKLKQNDASIENTVNELASAVVKFFGSITEQWQ
jgi:hypothetical protein